MAENIRVGWLHDHSGMKFAPKTLSTQILNTDGTSYKTTMDGTIAQINDTVAQKSQVQIITWEDDD